MNKENLEKEPEELIKDIIIEPRPRSSSFSQSESNQSSQVKLSAHWIHDLDRPNTKSFVDQNEEMTSPNSYSHL